MEAGDALAAVFSRDPARRARASEVLDRAFTVGDERPQPGRLVLGRMEAKE